MITALVYILLFTCVVFVTPPLFGRSTPLQWLNEKIRNKKQTEYKKRY